MGNETFLHLSKNLGNNLLARTPNDEMPAIGQEIKMYVNLKKIHFFDTESEEAIEE